MTVGAYLAWYRQVESLENPDNWVWRKIADFNARRGDYADVPTEMGPATIGYYVPTSADGSFSAYMLTNRFRPYVGIGFGRAVPGARRLNAQLDLGVQFWGRPRLYDGITGKRLTQVEYKSQASFGRNTVYPVITIHPAGRKRGCLSVLTAFSNPPAPLLFLHRVGWALNYSGLPALMLKCRIAFCHNTHICLRADEACSWDGG